MANARIEWSRMDQRVATGVPLYEFDGASEVVAFTDTAANSGACPAGYDCVRMVVDADANVTRGAGSNPANHPRRDLDAGQPREFSCKPGDVFRFKTR